MFAIAIAIYALEMTLIRAPVPLWTGDEMSSPGPMGDLGDVRPFSRRTEAKRLLRDVERGALESS